MNKHWFVAAAIAVAALSSAALLASPPAEAQQLETMTPSAGERRCCWVERRRWVTQPKSFWTPQACTALGAPGEYAPQGTSGAGACARTTRPPPEDPVPPHDPPDDPPRTPGGAFDPGRPGG